MNDFTLARNAGALTAECIISLANTVLWIMNVKILCHKMLLVVYLNTLRKSKKHFH